MDDERDMNKLMGDAVAKFIPSRHRNAPSMPEPALADKLAVTALVEALEKEIDETHKRLHEAIQRIRDQVALADRNVEAGSQKMHAAAQDMIDAIRSLRG